MLEDSLERYTASLGHLPYTVRLECDRARLTEARLWCFDKFGWPIRGGEKGLAAAADWTCQWICEDGQRIPMFWFRRSEDAMVFSLIWL